MYLYENGEPGNERYATLFRRTLPTFGGCTAADIDDMFEWAPTLLEYAVLTASGYLDADEDDEEPEDEKGGIWASKSASEKAKEEAADIRRSDLVHALHQHGEPFEQMYSLLMPEIEDLFEGADRAHERRQENSETASTDSTEPTQSAGRSAPGNRGDRASQLGWR